MNDTFAVIYAEHGNPLLGDLISRRCVSALPLAGRYRTIDVLLSNLAHSGIRNVGVIMQRNFQSLVEHISSGDAWDLNKKNGGISLLTPFDQGIGTELYHDVGDALFAKRYYLTRQRARYCLLLASDTIYRQDYNEMLEYHIDSGADMTLLYTKNSKVCLGDTSHLVHMGFGEDGWLNQVNYAKKDTKNGCFYVGACLVRKDILLRLMEDTASMGHYSMIVDIISKAIEDYKVAGFEHKGYIGRLSTVKSYFDVMKDTINPSVRDELFFDQSPVYTRVADAPPIRFLSSCAAENSVFGNGCTVKGRVRGSVLFRGVTVDEGADVENCIIMQDCQIGSGAVLKNVIADKGVIVESGSRLIGTPDSQLVIRKGTIVKGDYNE